jgi:hypothetical protein
LNLKEDEKLEFVEMMDYYKMAARKKAYSSNELIGWLNMGKAYQEIGSFNDSITCIERVIDIAGSRTLLSGKETEENSKMKLEALKIQYTNYAFTKKSKQILRTTLFKMLEVNEDDPETLLLWSKFKRNFPEE